LGACPKAKLKRYHLHAAAAIDQDSPSQSKCPTTMKAMLFLFFVAVHKVRVLAEACEATAQLVDLLGALETARAQREEVGLYLPRSLQHRPTHDECTVLPVLALTMPCAPSLPASCPPLPFLPCLLTSLPPLRQVERTNTAQLDDLDEQLRGFNDELRKFDRGPSRGGKSKKARR
jgi:hypothetical protein